MRLSSNQLLTPIYLKLETDTLWPQDEKAFYLLTAEGLFLCRNHPFFQSSVVADRWPAELASHKAFIRLNYPKMPQRLLERVVGFFSIIGRRYGAEAAVLLAWDRNTKAVVPVVPEQRATVSENWYGEPFPIDVHYKIPDLPPNLMLIGDLHSHVFGPAYASGTDQQDESFRAGLHVVIGRIDEEPPEFHLEVTVDAARFKISNPDVILAGYQRRREHEVPQEWIDQVTVNSWNSSPPFSDRRPDDPASERSDNACAASIERTASGCSQTNQQQENNGDVASPATTKEVPSRDETQQNRRHHD